MLKHGLQDKLFRLINCVNGVSRQVGKSSKCLSMACKISFLELFMINCINGECPGRLVSRLSP